MYGHYICKKLIQIERNDKYNNKLKILNQCFAHIGIGYGLYTTTGDVYDTKGDIIPSHLL